MPNSSVVSPKKNNILKQIFQKIKFLNTEGDFYTILGNGIRNRTHKIQYDVLYKIANYLYTTPDFLYNFLAGEMNDDHC